MSLKSRTHHGFKNTLNTIELSDAFRRHARYKNPLLIKIIVKEVRDFAALSTWYDPAEKFRHTDLAQKLANSLERINDLASKLNVDDVILPVDGSAQNPFTPFFKQDVLPKAQLTVSMSLQKSEYSKDLSTVGKIDKRIKTALDEGLRGVMNIKDSIKYKW